MNYATKRRHTRFKPDNSVARITFEYEKGTIWEMFGLVTDESFGGCGLVVLSPSPIDRGTRCLIAVGEMAELEATVRWIQRVETGIMRIGVQFQQPSVPTSGK